MKSILLYLLALLLFSQSAIADNKQTFVIQAPQTAIFEELEGCLVWTIKGKEILKVTPNGDFYVEGRFTTNDKEIYQQFKKWLDDMMKLDREK